MNTGDLWPDLDEAELRVHEMQTKLHQWAISDPGRRFDDLYNLVYDPAFLVVAWSRVRGDKRARSAGVDGVVLRSIVFGISKLLGELREDLKARRFFEDPQNKWTPNTLAYAPAGRMFDHGNYETEVHPGVQDRGRS